MPLPVPRNMMIQSSQKLSIDFFTDEELGKIFEEISRKIDEDPKRKAYHQRYFILVKFLLRTGGRIDEVLQLRPCDINLQTNTVRIITLKQGKDRKTGLKKEVFRILPMHPDLRDIYMQYLLETGSKQDSKELLFPMKRQVVDLYLKKIQSDIGLKIHAHKFRHTFAVKAIMDGVPLNVLQQWMGHSSVLTTSIYTQITGMDTSQFMERVR